MSKQTNILIGEVFGAIVFSICLAFSSYFYTVNSFLTPFGGFISIGGDSWFYAMIGAVFGAWIGMLVGGIIGLLESIEKSSKLFACVAGLSVGVFSSMFLYSMFKLNTDVSVFFIVIFVLISVVCNLLLGFTSHSLIKSLNKLRISGFHQILLVVFLIVIPLLTSFGVAFSAYRRTKDIDDSIQIFVFIVILTIVPLLVLWLIFLSIASYKSNTKN